MEMTIDQALQQAVEAHRAGRLPEAEGLYRAILQAQPRHPHAAHNLGVLAVSVGQVEAALPFLKAALESGHPQEQFWVSYIDALIKAGQPEAARQVLAQAKANGLSIAPAKAFERQLADQTGTPFERAVKAREAGDYPQARLLMESWLATHPDDAEAWSLLSQVCLLGHKAQDAERALARAEALSGAPPSVFRNRARLLLAKGQHAAALNAAEAGHAQAPNDAETWLVLGACLAANQRDQDAAPWVERALQARPGWAEALSNRALIRLRAGDRRGARLDLETAVAAKPHLVQLWGLLASIRHGAGDSKGAIAALERAHALQPDNPGHAINLGELLRQDRQTERAIGLLQSAVALAPANANAWTNLGVALLQAERVDEAKVAYQRALDLNPNSAETLSSMGVIAKDARDWPLALEYFQRAMDQSPDNMTFMLNKGGALMSLRRYNEAESLFGAAVSLEPDNPHANRALGVILAERGAMAQAQDYFVRALSVDSRDLDNLFSVGDHALFCDQLDDAAGYYVKIVEAEPDDRGLRAAVNMAILHYLKAEFAQSRAVLDVSHMVLGKPGDGFKPYRIYWKYLHELLRLHESRPAPERDGLQTLHVIGESHALASHNVPVQVGDAEMIGRAKWISGCKQWHLGRPTGNRYKHKFQTIVSGIPRESSLLLAIGEIDCRPDEGILRHRGKNPGLQLREIVDATVSAYLTYVSQAVAPFGHRVTIQAVPCPDPGPRKLTDAEAKDVVELIGAFNGALKEGAQAMGFGFLDVHTLTDRGDGLSNQKWEIDAHHLTPEGMQEAWRAHHLPSGAPLS